MTVYKKMSIRANMPKILVDSYALLDAIHNVTLKGSFDDVIDFDKIHSKHSPRNYFRPRYLKYNSFMSIFACVQHIFKYIRHIGP